MLDIQKYKQQSLDDDIEICAYGMLNEDRRGLPIDPVLARVEFHNGELFSYETFEDIQNILTRVRTEYAEQSRIQT